MRTVCGLDVHKDSVFVCIINENGVLFQEKFGVLTPNLERMVDVLQEYEVTEVCMEVVLSACNSGQGDIGEDGIYGLQRAFKMAGAKTILMSLWEVDDETTKVMMQNFTHIYINREYQQVRPSTSH